MSEVIKVLIVDDKKTVRAGLRMRLELEPDLAIAAEAGDGLEALRLAREVRPDVVVMDVEMPHMDGLAAATELQATVPSPRVVMSSIHDDTLTRARAAAAGAAAFVGKQEGVEFLIETIRRVAASNKENGMSK